MSQEDQPRLPITEKIKAFAYNTKFMLMGYLEEYNKTSFLQPKQNLHIFGREFQITEENIEKVQEEVYEIFQKTIWLTYRAGFPDLPNEIVGSYVSDTGWGCMVRVGQMFFAQIIKFHTGATEKEQLLNIVELFSDFDKNQPFTIHKIARMARIDYGLKPGDWYNPSQISFILANLHEKSLAKSMKLDFIVFNSGNLFFDSITKSMVQDNVKCECEKSTQFVCEKCNNTKSSVSLIILCRLGLDKPEKKYLDVLEKLMELKWCQGIMGGKPRKALYFIGKQDDYFIYLDPHYVHEAEQKVKKSADSFFCGSLRKCKITAIDSSIGICFYLKDIKELNGFYEEINRIKKENEDLFIFVADKTPEYIKMPVKVEQLEENDESFELI